MTMIQKVQSKFLSMLKYVSIYNSFFKFVLKDARDGEPIIL